MPTENPLAFVNNLVFAVLLNILLIVLFVIIYILLIETKRANQFNAIKFRQALLTFSLSIYIFTLLPIYFSFFVWLLVFVLLREVVFKNDAIRKQHLYSSKRRGKPYPKITNLSQIGKTFFSVKGETLRHKDFKYSFHSYSDTGLLLLAFSFLGIAQGARFVGILYLIEVLIVLTVFFMFLGKFVRFASSKRHRTTASSAISSKTLLVLIGVIYYSVLIAILFKVYGIGLLSF